jgi:hypothetical protein
VSPKLLYPRGIPLTESMPFTDRDGARWLVYIEGVPELCGHLWPRATIPSRHLRFDSAAQSRVTTELPAGSPFLSDARLQDLLDRAHPVPVSPASTWPPLEAPVHTHRATEWATRTRKLGSAVLADWSRERSLSAALHTALTLVVRIASGRRLKPR